MRDKYLKTRFSPFLNAPVQFDSTEKRAVRISVSPGFVYYYLIALVTQSATELSGISIAMSYEIFHHDLCANVCFYSVGVNVINKSFVMETRIYCSLLPRIALLGNWNNGELYIDPRTMTTVSHSFSIFTSHVEHKIQYIGCVR